MSRVKVTVSWRTSVEFEVEGERLDVSRRVYDTPVNKLADTFEDTKWEFLAGLSYTFEKVKGYSSVEVTKNPYLDEDYKERLEHALTATAED